ncbi:hypothetical protein Plec18167_000012 [Paecilomyces lecythidis]|uniref:Uncharacterized protein n=1 Tax=Paecilomyces lecythidis TaxID=3004212 RepID=A0ABR3YCP8_9EURO
MFNSSPEIENRRGNSDPPMIGYRDDDHDGRGSNQGDDGYPDIIPDGRAGLASNGTNDRPGQGPWDEEDDNGAAGDEPAGSTGPTVHPSGLGGSIPLLD